jgi:radical SAM superfamily enzyme with C-terminal helix-hairpin-helix motif
MVTVIVDCYTDEPAGLGVPPYLGTYPRYIAGWLKENNEDYAYITIDDLRLLKNFNGKKPVPKPSQKTSITVYNTTKNKAEILNNAARIIVILGVHTPGKYLSAVPGTLKEITRLLEGYRGEKILTGPAVYGTSAEGGKFAERTSLKAFDKVEDFNFSYDEIERYAVEGAEIINQIPDLRVIEIETGRGCSRKKGCSFCTEPIKSKLMFRNDKDVLKEISAFSKLGANYFRLGKQSCFYSYPKAGEILASIRNQNKNIKVLHIDNVNPTAVLSKKGEELTKQIVKYCTPGNVAAFGVESFDKEVVKQNNLNTTPEHSYEAIKIINKYGAEIGENGMPKFLPGINFLFGLIGESKSTNDENLLWLKKIMDSGMMLRRINIRQVNIFEGTPLHETTGNKFIKKNKKYYWSWRKRIREEIDYPMLKKVVPEGNILKNVRMEIYDGKTTFGRQIGTYPLIVGVKGRLELGKFYKVKVASHMLRSVVGIVNQ